MPHRGTAVSAADRRLICGLDGDSAVALGHDLARKPAITSAAHLTFGTRSQPTLKPNVRCRSCTRIIMFLVFLLAPTLGRKRAALGTKCRRRNTSVASLVLGLRLLQGRLPRVSDKSNTGTTELLVFLMSQACVRNLASGGKQMSETEHQAKSRPRHVRGSDSGATEHLRCDVAVPAKRLLIRATA